MIQITYTFMVFLISVIWIFVRILVWKRNNDINWKREMQLVLVYICLVVVARFVFCPFSKVNGMIQPLIFDSDKMLPFRINLVPLVHLFDYIITGEAWLNLIGNTAMFVPIGIIWPVAYKELNTHKKVVAAGVGFSLLIEILQLPFYDRVTDIDDLIMNSTGFILGYIIYLITRKCLGGNRNGKK